MTTQEVNFPPKESRIVIDSDSVVVLLEVVRSQIVLLQSIFESYDGPAVVKTIDESRGVVCLITTPDCEELCYELLDSLRQEIPWRYFSGMVKLDNIFEYVVS